MVTTTEEATKREGSNEDCRALVFALWLLGRCWLWALEEDHGGDVGNERGKREMEVGMYDER